MFFEADAGHVRRTGSDYMTPDWLAVVFSS